MILVKWGKFTPVICIRIFTNGVPGCGDGFGLCFTAGADSLLETVSSGSGFFCDFPLAIDVRVRCITYCKGEGSFSSVTKTKKCDSRSRRTKNANSDSRQTNPYANVV